LYRTRKFDRKVTLVQYRQVKRSASCDTDGGKLLVAHF
jgi:hypothetical protein